MEIACQNSCRSKFFFYLVRYCLIWYALHCELDCYWVKVGREERVGSQTYFLTSFTFSMGEGKWILDVSHYPVFFDFSVHNLSTQMVKGSEWRVTGEKKKYLQNYNLLRRLICYIGISFRIWFLLETPVLRIINLQSVLFIWKAEFDTFKETVILRKRYNI